MKKNTSAKIKRLMPACLGLLSRRFKILAWHSIAPKSRDPFETSVEMFQQQMQVLHEENYRVVSLEQGLSELQAGRINSKTIVITFDDGFKSLQDYAFPVLEQYSFPATVFVPFNHIGGIDSFSYVNPRPDFEILALDEIETSMKHGISYGSHTMSHVDLTHLADEELSYELNASKKYLSERLGTKFSSLAYPFGMFNDKVQQAARNSGYDCALCFGNVLSNSRYTDRFEMKREKILRTTSIDQFRRLINVRYDFTRKISPYLSAR